MRGGPRRLHARAPVDVNPLLLKVSAPEPADTLSLVQLLPPQLTLVVHVHPHLVAHLLFPPGQAGGGLCQTRSPYPALGIPLCLLPPIALLGPIAVVAQLVHRRTLPLTQPFRFVHVGVQIRSAAVTPYDRYPVATG